MANTQIKNNSGSNIKTVNGVTYFKLISNYPGDYTKNCGLLGNEIDENFYFLRGYDIAKMTIDKDMNLVLTRVNGEKLIVNVGDGLGEYEFSFDDKTGTLTVTYPNGETVEVDGFAVNGKIAVATDETLTGDGRYSNPLGLSRTLITGQYSPADRFVDLTDGSEMEPGTFKGERLVTKETVDIFGKLYTSREVMAIQELLGDSGWRVPTADDWNDLCNTIECPEDKNHDNTRTFHGRIAGKVLKSTEMWDEVLSDDGTPLIMGSDERGFRILPVGTYPDGPIDYNPASLYKKAGFWSQTKNAEQDYFTKLFCNDKTEVKSCTSDGDIRLSLRLVKDGYDKNGEKLPNYESIIYDFKETEIILGQLTPIVRMESDRRSGYTLWTQINMSVGNGVRPEEWNDIEALNDGYEPGFFICEWDGTQWIKRQMLEGDSVVIKDYDGDTGTTEDQYKEWRLVKGELKDVLGDISDDLQELSAFTENLSDELHGLHITKTTHDDDPELPSNVLASYVLSDKDGNPIPNSATIEVYKDSTIAQIYLGHVDDALISTGGTEHTTGSGDTALCIIYHKEDGSYELVAIDVEDFLEENEFKDGLQVDNHEVSVKKDPTSDDFLSISQDGVKVSGIQAAIDQLSETIGARLDAIEDRLTVLENKLEDFILGTPNQIQVQKDENGKFVISFDDEAIFNANE